MAGGQGGVDRGVTASDDDDVVLLGRMSQIASVVRLNCTAEYNSVEDVVKKYEELEEFAVESDATILWCVEIPRRRISAGTLQTDAAAYRLSVGPEGSESWLSAHAARVEDFRVKQKEFS
jgi:hypothetical protein